MRRIVCLLIPILLFLVLDHRASGATESDSILMTRQPLEQLSWVDRNLLESGIGIFLPIVAYDALHLHQDKAIKSIREQYFGKYKITIDDYLIPVPLLTVWGMRLYGIEGRSISHIEALTAQGLSIGIAGGVTEALKYASKRMRPDESTKNSFPSGHTALAFATAAILDAEYGAKYPWLSALGYGMATSVGVARIANNRHWATDVVTGAAVGMVSTYVGYLLNDLVWGRGFSRYELDYSRDPSSSPYYLSLQKSFNTLLSHSSDYHAKGVGNGIGITARVPLYRQIGVIVSGSIYTSNNNLPTEEFLHGYSVMLGPDFMKGFWNGKLWMDGSLTIGYLSEIRLSEDMQLRSNSIPFIAPGPIMRLGIGATILTSNHFALQLNGGYNIAPLSRPYSRVTKQGLNGIDLGLGLVYVIH